MPMSHLSGMASSLGSSVRNCTTLTSTAKAAEQGKGLEELLPADSGARGIIVFSHSPPLIQRPGELRRGVEPHANSMLAASGHPADTPMHQMNNPVDVSNRLALLLPPRRYA